MRAHARGRSPWDRLIIGPWGHDRELSHVVGDRNLGGAGFGETYGVVARTLDFYDAVLAGREPDLPPVSVYVLGDGRWVALPSWPPPAARRRELNLVPALPRRPVGQPDRRHRTRTGGCR